MKAEPMTDAEARQSRNERSLRVALRRWARPVEVAEAEGAPTASRQTMGDLTWAAPQVRP